MKEGAACSYLDLRLIHIFNIIDGFDEELKNKILHVITSHLGKTKYGSPKESRLPKLFHFITQIKWALRKEGF